MDRIKITQLEVFARHGVFPEENTLGQKFLIDATLYLDLRKAGDRDEIASSVDYGRICHQMDAFMHEHTFRLIEACAYAMARFLLKENPLLMGIDLEIKKPWAPISLPVEFVSACISKRRHTAYIALGSNMGDKEAHLRAAIEALRAHPDCEVLQVSSLIGTKPYGPVEQDDFLRCRKRKKGN